MPKTAELLADKWSGIDRIHAAFSLASEFSPDTTDCNDFMQSDGILGSRAGRKLISSFAQRIQGVVPFTIPGLTGRVLGDINGNWYANSGAWAPTTPLTPKAPTYDIINITIAALSITGGNFAQQAFGPTVGIGPFDLSTYDLIAFASNGGLDWGDTTLTDNFFGGAELFIEGRINGVFTPMLAIAAGGGSTIQFINGFSFVANGSLDAIRGHLLGVGGNPAGTSGASGALTMYLVKNALPSFLALGVSD